MSFHYLCLFLHQVGLKINYSSPLMTLLLPTVLIVLADFVSFALPLHGGGRNGFKVTLVLSFVMFLNLLNSQLPGNGDCSPIIRESPVKNQTLFFSSSLPIQSSLCVPQESTFAFAWSCWCWACWCPWCWLVWPMMGASRSSPRQNARHHKTQKTMRRRMRKVSAPKESKM